ncbi:TIGR03885 family FMN-dependent LLM class oxidoreductase [Aquipuribacter sp. SD81]|uniref:TIGR03885 family FMN-dependent LLM class oxidoreductase n=1 Tax=Aquipuribacter sp. SD81 TaxID=3127703 RepID=UPI00301B18AC
MTAIGFHASHEQVHPTALLRAVQRAEQAGFTFGMSSDHFSPWSARQGHSGFAWSWLGAALATTSLPFGVVNAPGQRYHPAVVAQAMATLSSMFPQRLWVALGTGENSNEHITGDAWPRKELRNQRLLECVDVIRRLLDGETVSHDGLVTVDRAVLWTRPDVAPALVGPAVSEATARWVGGWADGLVTVNAEHDTLRRLVDAYREAGGPGPLRLQVHVSWAPTDEEALAIAHDQWRTNVFPPPVCWDLETPEHFDAVGESVEPDAVRGTVLVSSDPGRHAEWLQGFADLGFSEIAVHHVGQEQDAFVDAYGEHVLPQLDVTVPPPVQPARTSVLAGSAP